MIGGPKIKHLWNVNSKTEQSIKRREYIYIYMDIGIYGYMDWDWFWKWGMAFEGDEMPKIGKVKRKGIATWAFKI